MRSTSRKPAGSVRAVAVEPGLPLDLPVLRRDIHSLAPQRLTGGAQHGTRDRSAAEQREATVTRLAE